MKEDLLLRLYNGCSSIEEFDTKEDWGEHEIVLGKLSGFIFTYGTIRLFADDEIGELEFHDEGTLVYYDGKYYGDFEIISTNNYKGEYSEINPSFLNFKTK